MKLLGYERVHGEKDGKKWDFVKMYIEKENMPPNAECGGSVILTNFNKAGNTTLPSIPSDDFAALLRKGLTIGSNIDLSYSYDHKLRVSII